MSTSDRPALYDKYKGANWAIMVNGHNNVTNSYNCYLTTALKCLIKVLLNNL